MIDLLKNVYSLSTDTQLNHISATTISGPQSYSSGITNTVNNNNNNIKISLSNNNKIVDTTITDDIYSNSNFSYNNYDGTYDVSDKYEPEYR